YRKRAFDVLLHTRALGVALRGDAREREKRARLAPPRVVQLRDFERALKLSLRLIHRAAPEERVAERDQPLGREHFAVVRLREAYYVARVALGLVRLTLKAHKRAQAHARLHLLEGVADGLRLEDRL